MASSSCGSTPAKAKHRARAPHCGRCGKRIHVPAGWSIGPAVRKHYWRHHRDVMQPKGGRS